MSKTVAIIAAAVALCVSALPAMAQGAQFPQGECTGVLCSTIGGSQAPQNQPRKSLFPEGECGGVLCNAIGGSQAPKPVGPPPACGGGLLCDIVPYSVGQPFVTPEEAQRRLSAQTVPPKAVEPSKPSKPRRNKHLAGQRSPAQN